MIPTPNSPKSMSFYMTAVMFNAGYASHMSSLSASSVVRLAIRSSNVHLGHMVEAYNDALASSTTTVPTSPELFMPSSSSTSGGGTTMPYRS